MENQTPKTNFSSFIIFFTDFDAFVVLFIVLNF